MKKALLILISCNGLTLFAEGARTVVTCSKIGNNLQKTEVKVIKSSTGGLRLLVKVNATLVYSKPVVRQDLPDRTYYISAKFSNANDAPTSLRLQIYESASRLLGELSEASYLPQTNDTYGLTCH